MVRKRIINPIAEERKEIVINCKEMLKDELFDMEECANFLEVNQKLTVHSPETLPKGSIKITPLKAESKIVLDLGVDVRKVYFKHLLRKYLHRKGLKDWIHVKVNPLTKALDLQYYNLNDE